MPPCAHNRGAERFYGGTIEHRSTAQPHLSDLETAARPYVRLPTTMIFGAVILWYALCAFLCCKTVIAKNVC